MNLKLFRKRFPFHANELDLIFQIKVNTIYWNENRIIMNIFGKTILHEIIILCTSYNVKQKSVTVSIWKKSQIFGKLYLFSWTSFSHLTFARYFWLFFILSMLASTYHLESVLSLNPKLLFFNCWKSIDNNKKLRDYWSE